MKNVSAQELPALATPTRNPPSGAYLLYMKNDNTLYTKDSNGVERAVVPSAGVPGTRQINTSGGLQGGGDLSADRTLSPVYGTTAGTVAQGNDARIVAAAVTAHSLRSYAGGGTLQNNTISGLPWPTVLQESGIAYNASTFEFTVPTKGRYHITGTVMYAANGTGVRQIRLNTNGSVLIVDQKPGSSVGAITCHIAATVALAAGDIVRFDGFQSSGGALAVQQTSGVNLASVSYVGPSA